MPDFENAAQDLYDFTAEFFDTKAMELELENKIAVQWWEETNKGNIFGKNEREREAAFWELHGEDMLKLMHTKERAAIVRAKMEAAEVRYRSIRFQMDYTLRVKELDLQQLGIENNEHDG